MGEKKQMVKICSYLLFLDAWKKKPISAVHYITECFIMQNQKLNNIDKFDNNEEHFVKMFQW